MSVLDLLMQLTLVNSQINVTYLILLGTLLIKSGKLGFHVYLLCACGSSFERCNYICMVIPMIFVLHSNY